MVITVKVLSMTTSADEHPNKSPALAKHEKYV